MSLKLTKSDSSLVVGIDPSLTGTGIVIIRDGGAVKCKTVKNQPSLHTVDRVRTIVDDIISTIWEETQKGAECKLIAIEGFSFGSKGRSLFEIGYLGWRIREELRLHNVVDVPPTALKKFASGKGNCGKEIIIQQVFKRWDKEFSDNNQADAFVLAKIAEALVNDTVELTSFQKEVITMLKKVS